MAEGTAEETTAEARLVELVGLEAEDQQALVVVVPHKEMLVELALQTYPTILLAEAAALAALAALILGLTEVLAAQVSLFPLQVAHFLLAAEAAELLESTAEEWVARQDLAEAEPEELRQQADREPPTCAQEAAELSQARQAATAEVEELF